MSLPNTGDTNWGIPLNNYIQNVVLAAATTAQASVASHTSASDPHGDRAYAQGLVSPITSGVNAANGFVKLNGSGLLPTNLLPVGSIKTTFWDVKRDFGATGNGSTDDSTAIQNALNAANSAGGGEVWVPSGTYGIGHMLVIYSNTWLHLSPGAVMSRITPTGGSAPSLMIATSGLGGSSSAGYSNILISGGAWDATGGANASFAGITSACTPIFLVAGYFMAIEQTNFIQVAGNPAVECCGMNGVVIRDCLFSGRTTASGSSTPSVRVSAAYHGYTPIASLNTGAYTNGTTCNDVLLESCTVAYTGFGTYPPTGKLLNDDTGSGYNHGSVTVTDCSVGDNANLTYPLVNWANINNPMVYGNQFKTAQAGFSNSQLASTINGGEWNIVQTSIWADGQTDFEIFALWGSVNCPAYAGGPQYMLYIDGTQVTNYFNGPVGSYPNGGAPVMGGGVIWHVTQPGIDRPSAGSHTVALHIKPWTGNTTYVLGPTQIYARPIPLIG